MRGINYGHHWTSVSGQPNSYNPDVARAELRGLLQAGYAKVRIAYPPFNSPVAVVMCKNMALVALELGFATVVWGVVGSRPVVSLASMTQLANFVTSQLAPWAQALGSNRLQLSVGNEEELFVDATTLTVAQAQVRIRQLMNDAKAAYTNGPVDYVTASSFKNDWAALGVPTGTKLGMNVYYELPAYASFYATVAYLSAHFPGSYYVAEYNTANGFVDAQQYGASGAERNWAAALSERKAILEKAGVEHYVFCYRDGGFGVTANTWALRKTDGSYRDAWYDHAAVRRASTRTYSV